MTDDRGTETSWLALERRIGYTFKTRSLLAAALTCPSYRAESRDEEVADNQRLEFLGDAVIGLLTAEHMFALHAADDEGLLTLRRSRLACGRSLAERARRLGIGACLRLSRVDEGDGGRDKDRLLTDALEALFGALWLDGGLEAAQAAYRRIFEDGFEADADLHGDNPKGVLQEISQRRAWPDSPAYDLLESAGPPHAPVYTVRARVACGLEASGEGKTKRAAEAAAARELLRLIAAQGLA